MSGARSIGSGMRRALLYSAVLAGGNRGPRAVPRRSAARSRLAGTTSGEACRRAGHARGVDRRARRDPPGAWRGSGGGAGAVRPRDGSRAGGQRGPALLRVRHRRECSVGFVTGGQTANFTCLLAARNEVCRRAGWDVERDGLPGAPALRVIAGAEAHVSLFAALRMLGFGTARVELVEADAQGRMKAADLRRVLETRRGGPTIVCAQAGNVNTGAFDPLPEIIEAAHRAGAWVHVDGAFGLWAAASPRRRALLAGADRADSWATDAHKWLNVPYDCGIAITAHPSAHRSATTASASYLINAGGPERNPFEWVPEASRRGRALPVYVALRTLGRQGVVDLVDRCCALAARMASALAAAR